MVGVLDSVSQDEGHVLVDIAINGIICRGCPSHHPLTNQNSTCKYVQATTSAGKLVGACRTLFCYLARRNSKIFLALIKRFLKTKCVFLFLGRWSEMGWRKHPKLSRWRVSLIIELRWRKKNSHGYLVTIVPQHRMANYVRSVQFALPANFWQFKVVLAWPQCWGGYSFSIITLSSRFRWKT